MKNKILGFALAESPRRTGYIATNFGQNSRLLRSAGFTLAEVLITIGVIGVVAAMTIPTLIANINAQRFRSQFKKSISTLNQAGRMAQAQYGFDFGDIKAQYGDGMGSCETQNPEQIKTICSLFNGTLTGKTYLDSNYYDAELKAMNYGYYTEGYQYQLSDGSIVFFSAGPANCSISVGESIKELIDSTGDRRDCFGWIDVNGTSKPNKEVSCSDGTDTMLANDENYKDCVVKNDANHLTDIYPIVYHDTTVEPASNAARYVLSTAK
ncbi:type II secretion system protein [bacterium]|nr:type II secretion system protein [bacterium]